MIPSTCRSPSVLLSIPEDLLQRVADRLSKAQIFDASSELRQAIALASKAKPAPIDMVLHCPDCGLQHIDTDDSTELSIGGTLESGTVRVGWDNPPHKSHLCRKEDGGCGCIWRHSDVPTNGVAAIKTVGKADRPGEKHGDKWGLQTIPSMGVAHVAALATTHIEVGECDDCEHVGINDSASTASCCQNCKWCGDSPKDDICPACDQKCTMSSTCPECGAPYKIIARADFSSTGLAQRSGLSDASLFGCDVVAQPLRHSLSDYHHAPGDGPLHATWNEKPHRIVCDLVAAVKFYAALSQNAPVAQQGDES